MTSTALTTTTTTDLATAYEPTSIEQAYHLAKMLFASRMLPKHIQNPEAAFALMVAGRELGLSAMQSIRSFHIIEGNIAMPAELILARVKRAPECLFFRLVESTAKIATFETHRKGEPHSTRMSFTIEEAQAAGLTSKDNWRKYAPAMLRARCVSALARAGYPEAVLGIYDPDELEPSREPSPVTRPVEVVSQRPTTSTARFC